MLNLSSLRTCRKILISDIFCSFFLSRTGPISRRLVVKLSMMSQKRDGAVSAISHDVASVSSSPEPFIFRQFTVREIVSPKRGNVSMKELSVSTYSNDKGTSISSYHRKGFSFSLNTLLQSGQEKKMLLAPEEISCQSPTTTQSNRDDLTNKMSSCLRSRSKNFPPTKRVKVDSIVDQKVPIEERHVGKRTQNKQNVQKLHWKYICIISLIPVIILLGISFHIFREGSSKVTWNANDLQKVLNTKDFEKNKEMPVILITGPSGVGKSLTSSMIASNFPSPGVSELVLPPLPPQKHIIQKCSGSGYNFIVLDSLSPNSINDSVNWVKKFLNEALWHKKPVIVVLIFNIQVWKDDVALGADDPTPETLKAKGSAVYSEFKNHGLKSLHIYFKSLTEEDLKNCIRAALQMKGLQEDHKTEKYVNVISGGIDFRREGCKRVWSRAASAVSN
ncbi:hypothetical protein FOCC_FOCC011449 [Frankliniella occidentalis]|nr:hypothetical protein FOCC_FOCC011449 [Frankliniella occidentalis]